MNRRLITAELQTAVLFRRGEFQVRVSLPAG